MTDDEHKKRSIDEMFGDEDSEDSGDEQIPRRTCSSILNDSSLNGKPICLES